MNRTVFCLKLHKEAPGLGRPPYPGSLGKKIFEHICQEAWQQWLGRQTMVINEYRLDVTKPESRKLLEEEMHNFFLKATPGIT